ncbi:MAG: hypothetical protein JWO82_1493 [Akkermansiaceae bacterium]|nr:hypothetical protein [Akkermansiaceae bacterium]
MASTALADPLPQAAPLDWLGPRIDYDTGDTGVRAGAAIDALLKKIAQASAEPISIHIDVPEQKLLEYPIPGRIQLHAAPAALALSYLVEAAKLHLSFHGGAWIVQSHPSGPDDLVTRTFEHVTKEELDDLGLIAGPDGQLSVKAGKPWLKEAADRLQISGETLVIRADALEIRDLEAMLRLRRRGFKIPPLNSGDSQHAAVSDPFAPLNDPFDSLNPRRQ